MQVTSADSETIHKTILLGFTGNTSRSREHNVLRKRELRCGTDGWLRRLSHLAGGRWVLHLDLQKRQIESVLAGKYLSDAGKVPVLSSLLAPHCPLNPTSLLTCLWGDGVREASPIFLVFCL
jgi:hypothetical protein